MPSLSSDRSGTSWGKFWEKNRVPKGVGVGQGSSPMAAEVYSELPANKTLPIKENWAF